MKARRVREGTYNDWDRLGKERVGRKRSDETGRVVVRKQLRRNQVLAFLRPLKPCLVGLEACGGAHHWARAITELGRTKPG